MVRMYGRVLAAWILGMAAVLCITRLAMAVPSMTAEEVAEACIEEMSTIEGEMISGVGLEANAFGVAVSELPLGTPVGKVFKLGAATSGRIDKIATSAASRVEKSWVRCIAKINRLNGDGSLLVDIALAHDQAIESIEVSTQSRQGAVANIVLDYIEAQ